MAALTWATSPFSTRRYGLSCNVLLRFTMVRWSWVIQVLAESKVFSGGRRKSFPICCGEVVVEDVVLCFREIQVFVDGREESVIASYHYLLDGIDQYHVGFSTPSQCETLQEVWGVIIVESVCCVPRTVTEAEEVSPELGLLCCFSFSHGWFFTS